MGALVKPKTVEREMKAKAKAKGEGGQKNISHWALQSSKFADERTKRCKKEWKYKKHRWKNGGPSDQIKNWLKERNIFREMKRKEMMGDSENSNLWYTDSSIQSIMCD